MSKRLRPIVFVFALTTALACHRQTTTAAGEQAVMDSATVQDNQSDSLVIVLRGKVRPAQIEGAFQDYALQHQRLLNKSDNSWLFTFDSAQIAKEDFIRLLTDGQFSRSAVER